MQDRSPPTRQNLLATHGRTIHWVTCGRRPGKNFLTFVQREADRPRKIYAKFQARCRDDPGPRHAHDGRARRSRFSVCRGSQGLATNSVYTVGGRRMRGGEGHG